MSALPGKVVELHRRRTDEVLQRSRNGADDEGARSNIARDSETDHVVAGSGDIRDQCPDETMEADVA